MKRLLIIIALLSGSNACWSQLSKGVLFTSPSNSLYSKPLMEPLLSYRTHFGIGWHNERWKTDRRFRVWDLSVGLGGGKFSTQHERVRYKQPLMPDADYRTYVVDATWKVGIPLFHREYDDQFFWYTSAGVGFIYRNYEGSLEYKNAEAHFYHQELVPKFLDYEIGFETRMGKDWYYNMSASVEATFNVTANISIRFLKRSYRLIDPVVR